MDMKRNIARQLVKILVTLLNIFYLFIDNFILYTICHDYTHPQFLLPSATPIPPNRSTSHFYIISFFFFNPLRAISAAWWGVWWILLALPCADLVLVTTAAVSSWTQVPCHIKKTVFPSIPSHPLAITFFLPPLFCYVPWALGSVEGWCRCPI